MCKAKLQHPPPNQKKKKKEGKILAKKILPETKFNKHVLGK
jgi:hypothetical protein